MSTPKSPTAISGAQAAISQPSASKGNRVYPKRVPSSVPQAKRAAALRSVLAGQSLHQGACAAPCAVVVLVEEWLRSIEREIESLRSELRGRRAA